MIYADNAATTKLSEEAFEAMRPFLLEEYGNASQPYSFSRSARKALKDARVMIASCINASPEEIFFTSGGTESDNWAIKGLASKSDRRLTVTSQIEHHAILNSCTAIEQLGIPVAYMPVEKNGYITTNLLRQFLKNETKLVSIMLANNEIGTIEPIAELAEIAHEHGAVFHTDAVQAVGHIPVDVKALGVDMLSASGHKFNAPKGVGFLYIKAGTSIRAYSNGGAQECGLRAGTENVASIVAMAYALRKNCADMSANSERLLRMEKDFFDTLDNAGVDYIRNGAEKHIPGCINISIKNVTGEMLLHRLDLKGICISTGSACNSTSTEVSHVIRAIGVPNEYAYGTIRVSFGCNNLKTDAQELACELVRILERK